MKYLYTKSLKAIALVVILLIIIAFCFFPLPVIVVSEQRGEPVLVIPMVHEKSFDLEYIHSVQKTPVQETLLLAPEGNLLLTSTTYRSLGVGLPFLPEEGTLFNDNGVFILSGLNRSFEQINLGFTPIGHQALLYNGQRFNLVDYFSPGAHVCIKAHSYSPAKIIWQAWLCEREV